MAIPKMVLPLLALTALLAACSGAGASRELGPNEVILRVDTITDHLDVSTPSPILLYGDGRLVSAAFSFRRTTDPAIKEVVARQLAPEALETVREAAREAGLTQSETYSAPKGFTAESSTTTFTFNDGGIHKVEVPAIGRYFFGQKASWNVRDSRLRLLDFYERLYDLEAWLPEGSVGPAEPARFARMIVVVFPLPLLPPPFPGTTQLDWPLEGLAELGTPLAPLPYSVPIHPARSCAVVEGEELSRLLETANDAKVGTTWLSEGKPYSVNFRPLLEGEPGCPAIQVP